MSHLLKKKMESGAGKPTAGAAGETAGSKGKKDKKKDAWSDEEDDYKIDVQVNEKKASEVNKPAIVNTSAGWEDVDLKIDQSEGPKAGNKWGDSLKQAGPKIDSEAFPTIGEEKKPEKYEKKAPANNLLTRNTQPASSLTGQEFEGDGRIKFKNSKPVANSLLSGAPIQPTQPIQTTTAPAPITQTKSALAEDDGNHVIKLKGKLKVEYKETSAEKRQREAENEIQLKELEKRKADKEKHAAILEKKRAEGKLPDRPAGEAHGTHQNPHQAHGTHQTGKFGEKKDVKPTTGHQTIKTEDGKMGRGHIVTAKEKLEEQAQKDGWMLT